MQQKGWIEVRVTRKRFEAVQIASYELEDLHRRALPDFRAGAHIDVEVRPGLVRQYSLCNPESDTHRYVIGVLRQPGSRGGSAAMHDSVEEGSVLRIRGPRNLFPLVPDPRPAVLLAGGIGITPIMCMADALAAQGRPFSVHYCTRSRDRTAFLDRLLRSVFARQVSFYFDDGPPSERLSLDRVLNSGEDRGHLYACGPSGFMAAVFAKAKQYGWAEEQIHSEHFSSPAQQQQGQAGGFQVRIASTGKIIEVGDEQTVVQALAVHGIDIPTSCEQGICGLCVTRVLEGEPDHRDKVLTAQDYERNDCFTPCCSRSRTPVLVLDL